MIFSRHHQIALLSSLLLLSACATTHPQDPYEPYNRAMFGFNDAVDRTVLEPAAKGYRAAVPSPVRTGVSNVFNNLRDVVSFGSNMLRLDIEKASIDLMRFGLNSTFGLGGIFDFAGVAQMPNHKNTLGDTFASWGWKNSNYLILPLSGPSTVRDSLGSAVTQVYYPEKALIKSDKILLGSSVIKTLDTRSQWLDLKPLLDEAALDKYAYTRDFYMSMRARQTGGDYGIEENLDIDDLVDETPLQDPALDIDTLINEQTVEAAEQNTTVQAASLYATLGADGKMLPNRIYVEIIPLDS